VQQLTGRIPSARLTARVIVMLAVGIYALANVILVTQQWAFDDIGAYLGAADRLQHGLPLYVVPADPSLIYRYAPWFAFAWIPFTHLPGLGVEVVWAGFLLAATGLAMWHLRRSIAEACLALLLGALLFRTAGWGNVQPLVVIALIWLLPTRGGPWAVGVAASLKVLPILFVLPYLWRREWQSAAIALAVAALLWAPILFFDLSGYPAARGLNLYDATLLMAVPAAIAGSSAGRGPGGRRGTPRTSPRRRPAPG